MSDEENKIDSVSVPIDDSNSDKQYADDPSLYDFQVFISQLKEPRASPILGYTKSFLRNFTSKNQCWTASEQKELINDFKLFIYKKFGQYEPFKSMDSRNIMNAREGVEKLIMGRLYNKCFSPCIEMNIEMIDKEHRNDLFQDDLLRKKTMQYKFIRPEHIELPSGIFAKFSSVVELSGNELAKINNYRAPRDKIVCVLNCCKVIFGILRHTKLDIAGADVFLPLLIYIILKGNVFALVSNIRYIDRFRLPEFLSGESAYYLSSLQGAINYILDMDNTSLNIEDKEAFECEFVKNQETLATEPPLIANLAYDSPTQSQDSISTLQANSILRPLDEATNKLFNKLSEFLSLKTASTSSLPNDTSAIAREPKELNDQISTKFARSIELKERQHILSNMVSMFPNIDPDIIQDVCIAGRYRVGACVDSLLSLMS